MFLYESASSRSSPICFTYKNTKALCKILHLKNKFESVQLFNLYLLLSWQLGKDQAVKSRSAGSPVGIFWRAQGPLVAYLGGQWKARIWPVVTNNWTPCFGTPPRACHPCLYSTEWPVFVSWPGVSPECSQRARAGRQYGPGSDWCRVLHKRALAMPEKIYQ